MATNGNIIIPQTGKLTPEQKEQRKHGQPIFPIEKYGTQLWSEYPFVPPHWHEEAEFTFIRKGHCTYQIQLQSFEVSEGDLIWK